MPMLHSSCIASLLSQMNMPFVRAGSGTQELAGSGDVAALPPPTVVEGAAAAAEGPAQSLGPGAPRCLCTHVCAIQKINVSEALLAKYAVGAQLCMCARTRVVSLLWGFHLHYQGFW